MALIDKDPRKKFKEALADIIVSSQGLCTYDACKDVAEREATFLISMLLPEPNIQSSNIKETIRAEIERMREINKKALELGHITEDMYHGRTQAQNGLLAFLDTLKETPTWVNRAEQRQKDQANGKKIAIMEIRAEIERRINFFAAQGRTTNVFRPILQELESVLAWLDTLPEQPASEEKFRNLLDAAGDCGFSQDDILLLKSIWDEENAADEKVVKELSEKVSSEITRQVEDAIISEDLEKEIADYIESCLGGLEGQEIASCARYFYDLGQKSKKPERNVVTREEAVKILKDIHDKALFSVRNALETLVPELAESDVLDEEIKRYFKGWTEDYEGVCHYQSIRLIDCYGIARHFAEWGAEHAKE